MAFEYVPYALQYGFELSDFFMTVANILMAIILTHFYRLIVQKWSWSNLPLSRLSIRVGLSVAVLGTVMTIFNHPIDKQILADNLANQPFVFWGYLANWCKLMLTWVLSYTIYHYVEQHRLSDLERIMFKTSIREAEAKVLRSQLNPHFTFNALNSIRALIVENPEKAQLGITQLSNILRNSLLVDRRKTVDLREELKTVEDYLNLEKIRYEDRLQFSVRADPASLFCQVPPMMLQTLVENGVKHGVSKIVSGGNIDVTTSVKEDVLTVSIVNSGVLESNDSSGIGLKNTAERLSLLYGVDARVEIFQLTENEVSVELNIPLISKSIS
ncbi:histidine kinase [Ravibacter arvi]|uniref:Histidine kinase n=2 Tax=Ravibacter arvi TaxID=2051041 RepID=A0ABP8LV26_9BACT